MSSVLARKAFLKRMGRVFVFGIMTLILRLFGGFLSRFLKTERYTELFLDKIKGGFFSGEEFFAEKSSQGLRVLSRKCPHLGCTLQKKDAQNKIVCPCHGSTFTEEGKYISGPAQKDMTLLSFSKTAPDRVKIRLQ